MLEINASVPGSSPSSLAVDSLRDRFDRDGIAFPFTALEEGALQRARAGFAALGQRLGADPMNFRYPHLHFSWARELATHPRVLDALAAVLGPELIVISSLILSKPPRTNAHVGWHQDGTYWNLHQARTASAWIALTPSSRENGCMRVIPGSHTDVVLPHRRTHDPGSMLGQGEEAQGDIDECRAIDVVLAPGQLSIHHNNIIHGSRPNSSSQPRTGFILRVVTPAFPAGSGYGLVVRGTRLPPGMRPWSTPALDDIEAALASHARHLAQIETESAGSRPSPQPQPQPKDGDA